MASDDTATTRPERSRSLSEEINVATRSAHTKLNRMITARLPLALPPQTDTPHLYFVGISHFARVYQTFESLWLSILSTGPGSVVPPRTLSVLQHLHLPALRRTPRLDADLAHLSSVLADAGRPEPQSASTTAPTSASSSAIQDFTAHIRAAVAARPHVLLAYAWVLYMALFAGGRHLRAQLRAAGPTFWAPTTTTTATARFEDRHPGLEFFYFAGDADGSDLKSSFRSRFSAAEALLTPSERQHIVDEAGHIFRHCILLVEELDGLVTASTFPLAAAAPAADSSCAAFVASSARAMHLSGVGGAALVALRRARRVVGIGAVVVLGLWFLLSALRAPTPVLSTATPYIPNFVV
ncbi:MAG: heme oxygenase [Thelocarpon superellum]|nr:MAG: heme oxygenase [Thelocarpon superellum]